MARNAPHFSATRKYDDVDRFMLFVEQLQVACDLVARDTLAAARAGLVCLDNLASLILNAHAERAFASGESSRWDKRKRYSHRERRKILSDFNRMLTVAMADTGGPPWRSVPAILNESDAAVMRVAHSYRNGVYHQDRHNPALIAPLTALYAQAIGRAFTRSHATGCSVSIGSERAVELANYGYEPARDEFPRGLMLDFGFAAQAITQDLTSRFQVDEDALKGYLAGDISERCLRCAETILWLLDHDMPADRLDFSFRWSQFWDAHGADDEWLRLQDERDRLAEELHDAGGYSDRDGRASAYQAASDQYIQRAHELQRQFEPTVTWGDAPRLGRRGERLSTAKDLASLLSRYERVDRDVEQLEIATANAADTWSTIVEREVDRVLEGD